MPPPQNVLSADALARWFGPRDAAAQHAVRALYDSVAPATLPAGTVAAAGAQDLVRRFAWAAAGDAGRLLAACRAYYALVVRRVVGTLAAGVELGGWEAAGPDARLSTELTARLEGCPLLAADDPATGADLFKRFYEALFPRRLRHALGEYYTPAWLVNHVLDLLEGPAGGTGPGRLLDPTCGSGSFLLAAIARLRRRATAEGRALLPAILDGVVGCELNPWAALTARANYLLAVRDLLSPGQSPCLPIHECDVILDPPPGLGLFDCVAGNPPWIAWDHLPPAYRQATKPLWERYGLFSLSATAARHGGGKKDLAALLTYVAADRFLRPGGHMALVVPQTLFQTKGAGEGFRRFRLGADGPPLGVQAVDDLVAVRPFAPASNWTSVMLLEKGRPTEFPVPYRKWRRGDGPSALICEPCQARPVDPQRPGSPWLVLPEPTGGPACEAEGTRAAHRPGKSDYTAHLGANSGGANGIYWLELRDSGPQGLLVRNVAERGQRPVAAVETWLEPELVYPLLRWSAVDRYQARPDDWILLCQDPDTRRGLDPEIMRTRYPRSLLYLEQFREVLCQRAAYRRYQARAAFYSMYNVGPYTLGPLKVVWRRMERRIRAVVVGQREVPGRGLVPVVPQETCVLVAVASEPEAHYLCALLNSAAADRLVRGFSVDGGKGFGSPGMLDFLPIRRFDPQDRLHAALAGQSRLAHAAAEAGQSTEAIQQQIDRLADQLWTAAGSLLLEMRPQPVQASA